MKSEFKFRDKCKVFSIYQSYEKRVSRHFFGCILKQNLIAKAINNMQAEIDIPIFLKDSLFPNSVVIKIVY